MVFVLIGIFELFLVFLFFFKGGFDFGEDVFDVGGFVGVFEYIGE